MNKSVSGNGLIVTLWACAITVALGLVVTWNYLILHNQQMKDPNYLPNIQLLEKDLKLLTPEGKEVSLHDLQGKVWVFGYIFTRCPSGCLGIVAQMKSLQETFVSEPDFHLVAITLDPENDTPEWLTEWTKKSGVGGDNWWFLTGDRKSIHSYMARYFKLFVKPRKDPQEISTLGAWEHEFKLVLVDHNLMIRYNYETMDFNRGEQQLKKLKKDVRRLLKEARESRQVSSSS